MRVARTLIGLKRVLKEEAPKNEIWNVYIETEKKRKHTYVHIYIRPGYYPRGSSYAYIYKTRAHEIAEDIYNAYKDKNAIFIVW